MCPAFTANELENTDSMHLKIAPPFYNDKNCIFIWSQNIQLQKKK